MKKFIAVFISFFAVTILYGDSAVGKNIAMENGIPVIIRNLNLRLNSETDIVSFASEKVTDIISIDRINFKPEVAFSNKVGETSFHKLRWTYKGVPIKGRYTVLKEKNGIVFKIHNHVSQFDIETRPTIDKLTAAKNIFSAKYQLNSVKPDFISNLIIVERAGGYYLAWEIRFRPESILDGRFFYVDAHTGKSLGGGNTVLSLSENSAKVFETNPIRDETPILVELPWVADDAEGKLTAELDEADIRKIVASNCLDLGDTMSYYGQEYPICTPTQVANKYENGNFIYEDWDDDVAFKMNAEDVYSEVSVYYHLTKIYKYILDLGITNFSHLSNHRPGSENNPIIGVSNFRMPSGTSLAPMDNAFYSPHNPFFAEMFFGDFEYSGDLIVLGQGSRADFAYDGDVIYHEFGHAIVEGVAGLEYSSFPDKYGFSNEALALNEGIADTFSFIISEDPCLGEYVSEGFGAMYGMEKYGDFYCLRYADNDNLVNEDFTGESHYDGLPAVSAHWRMYEKAVEQGFSMDDFAKYFMKSLMSITRSNLQFRGWADILLSTLEDSNMAELANDFEKILEEKHFFNEIRARNITKRAPYLTSGGVSTSPGMPSSSAKVEIDGFEMEVAPMYVQLYYDVPECIDTLTITGTPRSQGSSGNPRYNLLVREGKPIIWTLDDVPLRVEYDTYIQQTSEWAVEDLVPGERYYMQFINRGPEGMLLNMRITETWNSDEECIVEPEEETDEEESDEEMTDDDIFADDPDDIDEKDTKSSGCSILIL